MDFSIIIPAKNEEHNIGRCLDSINAMDFDRERFEILLIDNGSSDRTAEIAADRGARVFIQPDVTISQLRNFGSSQAKGRILAFLDADCTVAENWLEEAARYLDDTAMACFGSPPVVPDNATWVQQAWFQVRRKKQQVEEVAWLESMNMFVRRDIFLEVGGFNEDLITCEDYDLSLRLQKHGPIIADQRLLAVHHGEAATLGHFFRKERWRGTSNLQGLCSHGFVWGELPSLLLPVCYLALALLVVVCSLTSLVIPTTTMLSGLLLVVLLWQGPLLLLAFLKNRWTAGPVQLSRLWLLFNVYYLARGGAMLSRG